MEQAYLEKKQAYLAKKLYEEIHDRKHSFQVLGIDISDYSRDEFFSLIETRLEESSTDYPPIFVITVNPEIVIQSIIDNEFKEVLAASSINTADGIGIRWAIDFLYGQAIERITGSDSMQEICRVCARHDQPVFLYGAMPTIADQAAGRLADRINELKIAGTFSPEHPDTPFEDLPIQVQENLKQAAVIFVALGAPSQEKWIYNNMRKLPSCKLFIGIGGSFDFVAGTVKRAPGWMCKSGLEWLYRLYIQPSRWRRMMKLPLFALNVIILKSSIGVNPRKTLNT